MRIAIVKLSALGDIVHAMVVLQFIKKFNKNISIDWIIEERYKDLVSNHPHVDEVYTVNLKKAKIKLSLSMLLKDMQKLRKLPFYDLVVDMQGLMKSAILSRIIPSSATLGFDSGSSRERFAAIFYNKTFNIGYEENVVKRNFELIKFALSMPFKFEDLQSKSPFLYSSKEYQNYSLSSSIKNVVIIPGASNPSKQYSVKKLAKLTQMIDVNFIIIWGNEAEKILADEITAISSKVNSSNHLSLDALISLISRVDLVIGGDTGPTHLAWALNIPSITLFGSTPGYRNTLETEYNKIIESNSNVNPNKIDNNDYTIRNIEVENIVAKAKGLLILGN
jgi:heptosyltransferase I